MTPRAQKTWIFGTALFGMGMSVVTALGTAPLSPAESRLLATLTRTDLEMPALDNQVTALSAHGLELSGEDEVRRGDTLSSLMLRMGVSDAQALAFIGKDRRYDAALRGSVGRSVLVQTNLNGKLLRLQIFNGQEIWILERSGENQFNVRSAPMRAEVLVEHRSVEVGRSFFGAMDQAAVPNRVTEDVVSLFESDIDFRRQVQAGDKVRVIYETSRVAGREVGEYRLLAVRFEASGRSYEALHFKDETGKSNYYDAEGKSVKRGFLAAPLRYERVTSNFSSFRLHPLFGDPRAHRGVDYAAPTGTPVLAVADGKVTELGRSGGYGNAIEIQHNQRYSTYYAHLSDYASGLKVGREVRMGEVIGYVGSTGWATGPHLHYEFRVQGRHMDPTKISKENPQVPSLHGEQLALFQRAAADLRKRLSLLDSVNTAAVSPMRGDR
ncbi:MAG: hypothetical protein EBQ76_08145 [Betaproteobacteria bacterium]|nr:hypothetical protein [Betaproteobacteria bacterium]